jgi:hypothetical protein
MAKRCGFATLNQTVRETRPRVFAAAGQLMPVKVADPSGRVLNF